MQESQPGTKARGAGGVFYGGSTEQAWRGILRATGSMERQCPSDPCSRKVRLVSVEQGMKGKMGGEK